ncbi:MAG: hypothetical protein ACREFP_15635 [Acetobacteraceae bacterium]
MAERGLIVADGFGIGTEIARALNRRPQWLDGMYASAKNQKYAYVDDWDDLSG